MNMSIDIVQAVVLFAAPCWIANMAFSLTRPLTNTVPFIARMDRPLDHGGYLWGERILGDSRKHISLVVAVLLALIWGLVAGSLLIGLKIMFTFIGTLLGSFIKRRLKLRSGQRLIVLDQLDYLFVVGGIWYFAGIETGTVILLAMFITLVGQPVISYLGYILGLKERPY